MKKKDKYEIYKPEAFKFEEDDFTPAFYFASILFMAGLIILFLMLIAGLITSIPIIVNM